MNINVFELLTYFIIYSFLGWCMESIVRSIYEKKIINTGFLMGPFCPIYGIGAIIMFLFLDGFENKPVLLFFIGVVVLTIWEYIVGVLLEKIFHTKYWDYSGKKFNFQGRVCLENSICWGILGVLFVKYIHPFIQKILGNINTTLLKYIMSIILIVIIADMIVSIIKMKNIKATLEKIEKLNKEIKERLKEIRALKKETEKTTAIESIQEMVENLKKKRNRTILHLYRNVHRLKKAFPAIDTKEITEVLNQRIQIIKQKNKKRALKNKK